MAFYRTSAPRLARMLEVAVKTIRDINLGMTLPENDVERAVRKRTDDTLAEIEKIAKGGNRWI